jgi:peroxiredoxin Q/BCP
MLIFVMIKFPSFKLTLTDGSIFQSSSIKNKTILFFYPKAMTSGCTIEVQEFQNFLIRFKNIGFTIIGCSRDSVEKNLKFSEKFQLKYLLASDLSNACEKLSI